MLKGGVFGFGGVGQSMTRQINSGALSGKDFKITAVANRGKEKRDKAANEFGLVAVETIDQLLEQNLDFVLILSTSHVHKEAAVKCAEAGVPYLLEKPIALTVEDAKAIVDATEKAGVINGVNYSMRYSPACRKMKQLVDGGELGSLLSVNARSYRGFGFYGSGHRHRAIAEPQESGAWIVHHMCHIVDFAIWIAGEIEQVYCATQSTAPKELDSEELIFSTVRFKNGAVGNLADQVGKLREHGGSVIGTKASISELHTGLQDNKVKTLLKLARESDPAGASPAILDPTVDFEPEGGLEHFLKCLKEGRPTNVPVREAWYSLKVCHAMRTSAKERRAVDVE